MYHKLRQDEKLNAVKRAYEREQLMDKFKIEEEEMLARMQKAELLWAEERKKMFEELSRFRVKKEKKPEVKPQVVLKPTKRIKRFAKPEPVKEVVTIANKIIQMSDASSQTEVNDDGLWQKQDGWVVQTSEDVLARALWRRAIRYASCPCCQGAGEFMKMIVDQSKMKHKKKLAIEDLDDDNEGLDKQAKKIRGRRNAVDKNWMLPDELVEFLCNLPKSVQGATPKPLPWLCNEINMIFDEKLTADLEDEAEGQQVQSMNDFLMELYLKRHGLRR